MLADRPDRAEALPRFTEWCKENDVIAPNVEIFQRSDDEGGYGLRATSNISFGDSIISLPRRVSMSTEDTRKNEAFWEFAKNDPILRGMDNVLLSVYLIEECCTKDSFWKPYTDILPGSYSTILYWEPDDLEVLRDSHECLKKAVNLFRCICRQYAYIYQIMKRPNSLACRDYITFGFYRWAVSTVMTRQNKMPSSDGAESVTGLIPFWDFANHENGQPSTDFDMEQSLLIHYAMRDFADNTEVTMFYGKRSNRDFLLHNGFIYADNANDTIDVKLGISKSDSLFAAKRDLLVQLGVSTSGDFKLPLQGQPLEPRLLAFLRVFHLTSDEMSQDINVTGLTNDECNSWKHLDAKINSFLSVRASLMLRKYGQQRNGIGKGHQKHLRHFLDGEMKILQSYIHN